MLLNAVTFLVIAAVLTIVVRPRYVLPRSVGEPWLASLRDGLAYLRRTPAARMLVLGITGLNVFVTPVVALGVALRVSQSGWGSTWLGLAEGGLAAGAIVGSLLAIRRPPARPARAAFTVLVLQGAAMTAVAADRRAVLVGAMVVIGVSSGLASVWLSGVFQRTIAASHLGRVSSLTALGDRSLTPVALLAFGAVAAGSGIAVACLLFGVAMATLCLTLATRRAVAALV